MKKIPSLFQRNYDGDRLVRNEVTPGAEWVIAGEGTATRKWDGTCCLIENGKLSKRYEVCKGKVWPSCFTPATEVDPNTGKQQGWVPVGDGPADQWHREGFDLLRRITSHIDKFPHGPPDGTYELCGPKVQGNPEGYDHHVLLRHGVEELDVPRTFDELKEWFADKTMEGIVWHHPDGRMVKCKRKDFTGTKRGKEAKL